MPEGVECLIVAEGVQRWMADLDLEQRGSVKFELREIFDPVVVRFSPILFDDFNECYGNVDYRKISTFGKTIFIPADNEFCMAAQLGMAGSFSNLRSKHSRVEFQHREHSLFFNDMRKFGSLTLFKKSKLPRNMPNLLKHSIDWRNKNAPRLLAVRALKRDRWRNADIKSLILNQQIIAGIGNIYACESLHAAKIDPRTEVKNLSREQLINIVEKCQSLMWRSHALGGMSIHTFESFGQRGSAKRLLRVYDKHGTICPTCKSGFIQRIYQNLRPTFYCPICQI